MAGRQRHQYRHLPAFILLALARGPIHGGAINSVLAERMPHFTPDSGAVYRTLQQLERDGEVVAQWDTEGHGPARKLYRLTDAGWERLDYWREDIERRVANLQHFLTLYQAVRSSGRH